MCTKWQASTQMNRCPSTRVLLATFGVYDLTNLQPLRGYTVLMTVVDRACGTFASALGGGAAHHFTITRASGR